MIAFLPDVWIVIENYKMKAESSFLIQMDFGWQENEQVNGKVIIKVSKNGSKIANFAYAIIFFCLCVMETEKWAATIIDRRPHAFWPAIKPVALKIFIINLTNMRILIIERTHSRARAPITRRGVSLFYGPINSRCLHFIAVRWVSWCVVHHKISYLKWSNITKK